jgi:hypothetical protein
MDYINNQTFQGTAITEINIPASVTGIGTAAFTNCSQLQKVIYQDALGYIGYDAFTDTPWLASKQDLEFIMINNVLLEYNGTEKAPVIPADTTSIAAGAFSRSGITEVVIPDSVIYIGEYAFYQCANLLKINLPPDLKEINASAFGLTALKEIKIPDKVTKIDDGAFYNCKKLKKISFGSGLQYVGRDAFINTPWLKVRAADEFVMIKDTILIKYNGTSDKPLIPEGTVCIAGGAFERRIPDVGVGPLDQHAFALNLAGRLDRSGRGVAGQSQTRNCCVVRNHLARRARLFHVNRVEDAVARVVGIERESD